MSSREAEGSTAGKSASGAPPRAASGASACAHSPLSPFLLLTSQAHLFPAPPCRQTALEALRAWPGGLHMGGGVTCDNAMQYLDAGASHVIVTSYVFREGRLEEERLKQLVGTVRAAGWMGSSRPEW
mgnify:CR=1 FL=1